MKKYKTNDVYILDVSKVVDYDFPSWHERITRSNILPYKYIAVKKVDKWSDKVYYQINGDGEIVLSSSSDTKERGDLFVRSKLPLSMTEHQKELPKKVTREWMVDLQNYLALQANAPKEKPEYVPDTLILRTIQTIEEYMAEPVERLCPGGRAIKKNFSLGQIDAYEKCLKLLRELVDGE